MASTEYPDILDLLLLNSNNSRGRNDAAVGGNDFVNLLERAAAETAVANNSNVDSLQPFFHGGSAVATPGDLLDVTPAPYHNVDVSLYADGNPRSHSSTSSSSHGGGSPAGQRSTSESDGGGMLCASPRSFSENMAFQYSGGGGGGGNSFGRVSHLVANLSPPAAEAASPASSAQDSEESTSDAAILQNFVDRYRDAAEGDDGAGVSNAQASNNLCLICGAQAGKHTYYGGKACAGCRAFFRRAVQSKYYDIFTCNKGNGKCTIDQKTRKDCQYCRFRKCLTCGMKPSWVLSNTERERRFNKRRKYYGGGGGAEEDEAIADGVRVKEEAANRDNNTAGRTAGDAGVGGNVLAALQAEPVISMASEDWMAIEKYNSFTCLTMHNFFHDYLCSNPPVMRDLTHLSYFGGTANNQIYDAFRSMHDKFAQRFFLDVEDFKYLPMSDQRKLISANSGAVATYKSVFNIMDLKNCLTKRMALDLKSGQYPFLQGIADDLKNLKLEGRTPHLSYSMFYTSPWTSNYADELRHFELLCKIMCWPRDSFNKPIDCIQVSLMIIIIAFTIDSKLEEEMERPELAKQLRDKYIYLLQRYLKFKYRKGDASTRYSEGLQMAAYAKEVDDIQGKRISTDWY